MFTPAQRDAARNYVLDLARSDPRVTAGALTGSAALEATDAWSDIDLAFGIAEGIAIEAVLADWTALFHRDLARCTIGICGAVPASIACSSCPPAWKWT